MAGITFRNAQTVITLSSSEVRELESVFHDWIDDSYTRGVECNDPEVLETYQATVATFRGLFDFISPSILAGVDA